MPLVFYLVAPSVEAGVAHALARGWIQTARSRFVTREKEDVRLIDRFNDLVPFAGGPTPMIKSDGYEDGKGLAPHQIDRWVKDVERFNKFVDDGLGEWLTLSDGAPPC